MPYGLEKDPQAKTLQQWLIQGYSEGLFDPTFKWTDAKSESIREWLKRGKTSGILLLAGELNETERDSLQKCFLLVVCFLLFLMFSAIYLIAAQSRYHWLSPIGVCLAAGLLGSATAAFISSLNRRANGFEDKLGNTFPDPSEKKERFNESMSYWLLFRPFLGVAMAAIAYWGMAGGIFVGKDQAAAFSTDLARVAFVGSIAGLFAKTLYELLQGILKGIFKTA